MHTETTFTTIAILSIITHPANMVMAIVPRAVAAFTRVERIQAYLLRPWLVNERQVAEPATGKKSRFAIDMQGVAFGEHHPILEGVRMRVKYSSLVMVWGLIGSGKFMLLRAIRPTRGSIQLASRRVAYYSHKP